jgi:hypothetical protein
MDTKFADALADRLYVAWIAEREAAHPTRNFRLSSNVPKAGKPLGKSRGFADFDHL